MVHILPFLATDHKGQDGIFKDIRGKIMYTYPILPLTKSNFGGHF